MSRPGPREPLPAVQLAQAIDRMIERADRPAALFTGQTPGTSVSAGHRIREQLGINDRVHYAWRTGGRPNVGLDTADKVLTRAGLLWWDVWNENTVRRPALTVGVYGRSRKTSHGRLREYRYRRAIVRYGDLGPDHALLEHVRCLWEPTFEEVAA